MRPDVHSLILGGQLGHRCRCVRGFLVCGASFAALLTGCSMETNPATNISSTWATLNGTLTWKDGEGPGEYWWEYSEDDGVTWTETAHVAFGRLGCSDASGTCSIPISKNVDDLTPGSHYIFRLAGWITLNGNRTSTLYGDSNWHGGGDPDPPYEYDSFDTPIRVLPDPNWWADHSTAERQAITNFAYMLSPQQTIPYPGPPAEAAADMVTALQAEAPTAPHYGDLARTTTQLVEEPGLIPRITQAIPRVFAAGTAFSAGWLIGSELNGHFLHIGLDDGSAPDETSGDFCYSESCGGLLHWYDQGFSVFFDATVQQSPGAYLYWGRLNGQLFNPVRWFEEPCTFSGFNVPPGGRLQAGVASGTLCYAEQEYHGAIVDYPYVTEADLLQLGVLHPYNPEIDGPPDVITPVPTDPGTSAVEEALEENTGEAAQAILRAFLDWLDDPERLAREDPRKVGPPGSGLDEDDPCQPTDFSPPPRYLPVRKPGYQGSDPRAAIQYDFSNVLNKLTGDRQTVHLYWGAIRNRLGWGYRHIVYRHGWGPTTHARTTLALQDPNPQPQLNKTSFRYYYRFSVGGTQCEHRTVVEFGDDERDNFAGPKHIITSFSYRL